MQSLHSSTKKIDTLFIICLFFLFTVTATILVLLEAAQYRTTVEAMNQNYEVRTTASYLNEKIRQHDVDGQVNVTDFCGTSAITLSEQMNDTTYTTYIYFYDGSMRELLVSDDSLYAPDAGQSIVSLAGFEAKLIRSGLIHVTFTDSEGNSHSQYLDFHTTGKEQS
jgi:hypothetical protein